MRPEICCDLEYFVALIQYLNMDVLKLNCSVEIEIFFWFHLGLGFEEWLHALFAGWSYGLGHRTGPGSHGLLRSLQLHGQYRLVKAN